MVLKGSKGPMLLKKYDISLHRERHLQSAAENGTG